NEIAGADRGDLVAHFFDDAAEFVAEGEGRMEAGGRPGGPAVNVEIRAADRGITDANEDLRGAERWNGNGFDLRATLRAHLAQSFHRCDGHRIQAAPSRAAKHSMLTHAPECGAAKIRRRIRERLRAASVTIAAGRSDVSGPGRS